MRAALGLVVLAAFTLPAAAADPIAVDRTGDANGEFVAISGAGNASCVSDGYPVRPPNSLPADGGDAPCASASLFGNASCWGGSILNFGGCAALSSMGNASCEGTCAAASGTGNAACTAWYADCAVATGTGAARGMAAVSGTGNASSDETVVRPLGGGCAELPPCPGIGFGLAISGTGDARCSGSGDISTCVPVSGTGHAPEGVSACDALATQGRHEACFDPDDPAEA